MIESIRLRNVATYDDTGAHISDLKKVNFFYGANGSGKTTTSNYLSGSDPEKYNDCHVTWSSGAPLLTLVYNKKFRDSNFGSNDDIAGVFTLGEATKEQIEEIKAAKSEQDEKKNHLNTLKKSEEGLSQSLEALEKSITDKCWSLCKTYREDFKVALTGSMGSKSKFRIKILDEWKKRSEISLLPQEELFSKSKIFSSGQPDIYPILPQVPALGLTKIESDGIWNKVIIGKKDVDIASLISELSNNDWVNQGRQYITDSQTCPFCQSPTIDDSFRDKLERYFDESFLSDVKRVGELKEQYDNSSRELLNRLHQILMGEMDNPNSKLDIDGFHAHFTTVESIIKANLLSFQSKVEKSSIEVQPMSVLEELQSLQTLIDEANTQLAHHNKIASDYKVEKDIFISQVWRFLVDQISDELTGFSKSEAGLSKGIEKINAQKTKAAQRIWELKKQIEELNKNVTSVQPAVDEINRLLKAYGFLNFKIVPSPQLDNHYCIQRQNGELVKDTLSEGEVTFITFLYYYQLAKGAQSQESVSESRVLVIDDPISSLDSNILYIVSALVKQLTREIKDDQSSNIKQMLLFTHNVYFHKEASFENGRSNGCKNTHFWIIRKSNSITSITAYQQKNPIESSYELLWREIKDRQNSSSITVQNTMRRILENYFKILGKFSDEDIVGKFDNPQEQQICRSLLYWINDGSHCLPDDLFIQSHDDSIEIYMDVFRKVFEYAGHLAHYKMMMGDDDKEDENPIDNAA